MSADKTKTKPTLSDAANLLPSREKYLAYQLHGTRCNLGIKYGLLKAQLAIGLSGTRSRSDSDRDCRSVGASHGGTASSMNRLIEIILSEDDETRNQSLDSICHGVSIRQLLSHAAALDQFRREADNLYHRVRSLFFFSAIYRYHLPHLLPATQTGQIPFSGYEHLLSRRFVEAIESFLAGTVV